MAGLKVNLQNRLILFFFVTSLGSALSSIASFLSVEKYFESLILLGLALSVRTFASAVFSYKANAIIERLGLVKSLLVSQIFGCLALVVLFLGFHFDTFIITILGIILTGLPSTFVAILISIILRISSSNSDLFRKFSGRRELVFGVAMLISSILAPVLLWKFSLNFVLFIDVISYLTGFILIVNMKIDKPIPEQENKKSLPLRTHVLASKSAQDYMIKTSASLLLAGLLPLLASSGKIQFTMDLPVLIRQWLWSIEDITAISASVIYLFFAIFRKQKFFEIVVMLSGIWLFVPIIFSYKYSIVFAAAIICLLTDFSGQKFRDDLIISAGEDENLIKANSALAQFQRNFIFFLSPILLSILLTYTNMFLTVATIIFVQLSLYIMHKLIKPLP